MDHIAAALLEGVRWLTEDPSGTAVLTSGSGETTRCTVVPGLDRLFARNTNGQATEAILETEDRPPIRVLLTTVPGLPGALVLPRYDFEREVGGALENLVNQLAHDVRNQVFTIGLQAELGERRSVGQPEIRNHFTAVLSHVAAVKRYMERLLLFGRPSRLELQTVDIESLLRETVGRFRRSYEGAGEPLSLGLEIGDGLPPARWDPVAVAQALDALLDNAVRSAEPPPPVTLGARAEGDAVVVEVRDSGAGIPQETLPLLTVPMAVRRIGGAGLGLPIARKVATAHGGRLVLASSSSGTVASLHLPREATGG